MAALEAAEGTSLADWPELYQGAVRAKCDDSTAPGRWLCLTHRHSARHNLELAAHTEHGEHVVAWYCQAHGVEQP